MCSLQQLFSVDYYNVQESQVNDCFNWYDIPKETNKENIPCLTWSQVNFGLNVDNVVNADVNSQKMNGTPITVNIDGPTLDIQSLFKIIFDDSQQRIESTKFAILDAIRTNTWVFVFPEHSDKDENIEGALRAWFFLMSEGTNILFTVTENMKYLHWVPVFLPTWKK